MGPARAAICREKNILRSAMIWPDVDIASE
jgi:hypothetical protein